MIELKLSDEQADFIANLLQQHKQNNQKLANLASDSLDSLILASKKEAEKNQDSK